MAKHILGKVKLEAIAVILDLHSLAGQQLPAIKSNGHPRYFCSIDLLLRGSVCLLAFAHVASICIIAIWLSSFACHWFSSLLFLSTSVSYSS